MAFSWIPIAGGLIDSAFGLGSTKAQVGGATQAASQIEKYNREAGDYLTGRVNQGRNDILEASARGRQYLEPYINAGHGAIDTLGSEVTSGALNRPFTLQDFEREPGAEWRRSEGQRGLQSSAAAGGNLFSGGTLKALDRYNQNFASNEYAAAQGRFKGDQNQRYQQLFGVSGQGLDAAGQAGTMEQDTGARLLGQAIPTAELGGSYLTNIGEAQAAARAARGSAYGNFYNDLSANAQGMLGSVSDYLKQRKAQRTEHLSY